MDRIKKLALVSLMNLLLVLLFISIAQLRPISISTTSAPFFQLPIVFWIVMIISPLPLYIIAKDSKNPIVPIACAVFYYFLFYSYGLYFISHPTISDVTSSARVQEILLSISHIKNQFGKYSAWPVYFVFSKVFTSVLSIGPITTLNMGFFSLLLIIPFSLSLFYKNAPGLNSNIKYFILPALYLSLSFNFINAQFVPQFLGLIYLLMAFGCYIRRENKKFFILLIFFLILCILTHAFMFVFFLAGVVIEKFIVIYKNKKYKKERLKIEAILRGTPITYYIILLVSLVAIAILKWDTICFYFHRIIKTADQWEGEAWSIFYYIAPGNYNYWVGGKVYPLYHLIPKICDQVFSLSTKCIVAISFLIVGTIFLKKRNALDTGIIMGCVSWFAAGLFLPVILGQRALQVVSIPLSKYFVSPVKRWSFLSHLLLIFILLSPSLFVANSMINVSLEGDRFVQDYNENIAGRFMDRYISNDSNVLIALNLYPTTYPNGFNRYTATKFFKSGIKWDKIDFVLNSSKLQKRFIYLNVSPPIDISESVIYDNSCQLCRC